MSTRHGTDGIAVEKPAHLLCERCGQSVYPMTGVCPACQHINSKLPEGPHYQIDMSGHSLRPGDFEAVHAAMTEPGAYERGCGTQMEAWLTALRPGPGVHMPVFTSRRHIFFELYSKKPVKPLGRG
jgi:ribosomal protein L37E